MKAMIIFTEAIRFLKQFLLQDLERKGYKDFADDEIPWVITVPAIWSNASKQFMRKAAENVSLGAVFSI